MFETEIVIPKLLGMMPFCPVGSKNRLTGAPPLKTLKLPIKFRDEPSKRWDSNPPRGAPSSLPVEIAPMLSRFCIGRPCEKLFKILGITVQDMAKLNSGNKIGPTGVICLLTQGAAKCIAHNESVKNIQLPHIDSISIHKQILISGHTVYPCAGDDGFIGGQMNVTSLLDD